MGPHEHSHTGEDCQSCEEDEEDGQTVSPGEGQGVPELSQADTTTGYMMVTDNIVPGACVVSEERGGLDHHEQHQAETHEQEGHKEAVEAKIAWTDLG